MSKKYIIKDTTMTGIGDAIREQTGNTELLSPAQMVDEIDTYLGDIKGLVGRTRTELKHNGIDYVAPYAFYSYSTLTSVELPNCTSVGNSAFVSCTSLNYISLPQCTSASTTAFTGCTKITNGTIGFDGTITSANMPYKAAQANILSLNFPACASIAANTFSSASYKALQEVYAPKCLSLGANAFQSCASLKTVYLPKCASASTTAFAKCTNITNATIGFSEITSTNFPFKPASAVLREIHLPECTCVPTYLFGRPVKQNTDEFFYSAGTSATYNKIQYVDLPACTKVYEAAFLGCEGLESVNLPACSILYMGCFGDCIALTNISLPVCVRIQDSLPLLSTSTADIVEYQYGCFKNCINLEYISLPSCSYIGAGAFDGCISLMSIYLNFSSVVGFGNNAFANTPILESTAAGYFGSIYVPASLVDAYKDSHKKYADRITAIPE